MEPGLGFPLVFMENVDHDTVWRASLNEIRQRRAHAPNCSVNECDGHCERRLSSTRSTQHIYVRNECERLFIEMSMLREDKAEAQMSARTSDGDQDVRKECAQQFPSALKHLQFRGVSSVFLTTKSAEKLMI